MSQLYCHHGSLEQPAEVIPHRLGQADGGHDRVKTVMLCLMIMPYGDTAGWPQGMSHKTGVGSMKAEGAYCVGRWMLLLELELCLLLSNSGDDGLIGKAQPCLLTTHQLPQHHSKGIHI